MTDVKMEMQAEWERIVVGLRREVLGLKPDERYWIEQRLSAIAHLQTQIHQLFLDADGETLCRDCFGACCELGKNHLTLANLLGYLFSEWEVPTPNFTSTCPFLGQKGCLHPVSVRPYTCVTFICDKVEDRLAPADQEEFYRLDKTLRQVYEEFDERYVGSSLRGIFIRAQSLNGGPFLSRR